MSTRKSAEYLRAGEPVRMRTYKLHRPRYYNTCRGSYFDYGVPFDGRNLTNSVDEVHDLKDDMTGFRLVRGGLDV